MTGNPQAFSLIAENFNNIDVGLYSAPTFTDLDGNGRLDLLVGEEEDGTLFHYEQVGTGLTAFCGSIVYRPKIS